MPRKPHTSEDHPELANEQTRRELLHALLHRVEALERFAMVGGHAGHLSSDLTHDETSPSA